MNRKLVVAALLVVIAAVAGPVSAGGGGGGKASSIPVRMKNVGTAPVAVNSVSGVATPPTLLQGMRTIAANGITQFSVNKGAFTSIAANPTNNAVFKAQGFETRTFDVIYLYAQADATAATLTGAPAGVKF